MLDRGLVRYIARECFGLATRLLALWVGYIAGSAFVNEITGEYRHGPVIASAVIGLVIAIALLRKADWLVAFSYGPAEAGAS